MKKIILISLLLLLPINLWAKVKVVTTLPVFAALANAVGGERIQVKALARPNQDPHFLPAKPSYSVMLNRADLLIHAGMGLEIGWLPVVVLQSRNADIQVGAKGNLNASTNIQTLEVPTGIVDRSRGDVHPEGNPHYFLDPRNGALIAKDIFKYLVQLDPSGETYYQSRLQKFLSELNQKLKEWETKAKHLRGIKIITYHRSWTYFANWLGIEIVGQVEPLPGIPPSSKHTNWLLKIIPQNQVKAIVMAPYYPLKVPEFISQKSKIPLVIAATNPAENNSIAYFKLFDQIIAKLNEKID